MDISLPSENSPQVEKIRVELTTWLEEDDWTLADLPRWVKGFNLPALGYDREPYYWLLHALSGSRSHRCVMAARIARFLSDHMHLPHSGLLDDNFYYNLFHLSAGLDCPGELAASLANVFNYFLANEKARAEIFDLRTNYNLNNAFREALITNQSNSSYLDIWKDVVNGADSLFPQSDLFAGFRGIVYATQAEQPCIDDIGLALKGLSDYLESDKARHVKFRRLLSFVRDIWPTNRWGGDWDQVFFRQAMSLEWPDWAAMELNNLAIPGHRVSTTRRTYLIWEIYLPFLEELKLEPTMLRRVGVLLEIEASEESTLFLQKASPTVEQIRLRSPFRSYKSILGVANHGFVELELFFDSKHEVRLASAISQARRTILVRLGFKDLAPATESNEAVVPSTLVRLLVNFVPNPQGYVGCAATY
jgi:hypothetical protein